MRRLRCRGSISACANFSSACPLHSADVNIAFSPPQSAFIAKSHGASLFKTDHAGDRPERVIREMRQRCSFSERLGRFDMEPDTQRTGEWPNLLVLSLASSWTCPNKLKSFQLLPHGFESMKREPARNAGVAQRKSGALIRRRSVVQISPPAPAFARHKRVYARLRRAMAAGYGWQATHTRSLKL